MRTILTLLAVLLIAGEAVHGQTRTVDFDGFPVAQPPAGFSFAHTRGVGAPGRWVVQEEDGNRFLAQLDADATRSRFPVAVLDDVSAVDVA